MKKLTTNYDYSKLLQKIRACGITQDELAEKIHISPIALKQKLNNFDLFSQSEIYNICSALNISPEEITQTFFTHTHKVCKMQT